MSKTIRRAVWRTTGVVVAALLVAACSGGGDSGGDQGAKQAGNERRKEGGTVTMATIFGNPTYIFPILSAQYVTAANTTHFIPLMWEPLFRSGLDFDIDYQHSLADEPEYTADRRTVTLTLKDWRWSDGAPLTTRDFEFAFNLIKANKGQFAGYLQGLFPDNVESLDVVDDHTVRLHLTGAVAPAWFNLNQVGNVVPLPQHTMDKTSADGPIDDFDRDPTMATQVFEFLTNEAKNLDTYDSNPLWQTVSGAWKLSKFSPDGPFEFAANKKYSGDPKPTLDKFILQPFTSSTAEVNALRSGNGPDIGGLPYQQLDQRSLIERLGYSFDKWPSFGINYIQLDFAEPRVGPIFRQRYFREALQHLSDQEGVIDAGFRGEGWPNFGPVPSQPDNPYFDERTKHALPSFDPKRARQSLEDHGWTVRPDGVSTCERPGTGARNCGEGVPAGAEARFTLRSIAQPQSVGEVIVQSFQSEARKVGIKIDIDTQPFNTVYAQTAACAFAIESCTWEMSFYDGWGYGFYPSGEFLFRTGGTANFGRFSDPETDRLVDATTREADDDALGDYQVHLAEQVPEIWVPSGYLLLAMIRSNLRGVDPTATIRPERWYYVEG